MNFKNLHLLISASIIIPVALFYGLYPKLTLAEFFNIQVESINLKNIFRATMGLYLGMALLWISGIAKPAFWVTATITNIVFMGGLALGRVISLLIDGMPSMYFLFGLILELSLAIWGVKNLKKYALPTK